MYKKKHDNEVVGKKKERNSVPRRIMGGIRCSA